MPTLSWLPLNTHGAVLITEEPCEKIWAREYHSKQADEEVS